MKISMGLFLVTVMIYQPGFSETQTMSALTVDAKGTITAMIVTNPQTSLGIEKEFDFDVDNQGTPLKGTVKFFDGNERALNAPEELTLMWLKFGGLQQFWDNAKKQGKTISYTSMNDIPGGVFGKQVRIYLNNGSDYFGKLTKSSSLPESFMLITGAAQPLQLDKVIIREIQQVK